MKSPWLFWGAIIMALGIGLGAFGAHALDNILAANNRLETWKTASQYHLIHGLALLVVGIWNRPGQLWVGRLFLIGLVLFSGSLYALCLTNFSPLGAITPIGGLSFIVGWILFACQLKKY